MLKLLVIFLSYVSLSLQINGYPDGNQQCVFACMEAFYGVTFGTHADTDDYYTGFCQDTLYIESAWICAKLRCTPSQIKTGVQYYQQYYCNMAKPPVKMLSYEEVIANYSDAEIANMRVIDYGYDLSAEIVNNTLVISDHLFSSARRTWKTYLYMYEAHFRYALAMYYFWAIVLFLGVGHRLFAAAMHYSTRRQYRDPEAGSRLKSDARQGGIRRLVRRYITLPATFGYKHQQSFAWGQGSLPTRITSILLFIFIAINVICSSVVYHAVPDYLYDEESTAIQIFGIVTDRTGILAVANMPILWLFAGRNNVFLWLTGWNFAAYNYFHRWISRIVIIQVIIHSIGYTWLYLQYGGREQLAESWKERFWWCGAMATICFSFLWLFSLLPIRQRCYEFFVISHILLALVALVGTFYHIEIYDGQYEPYLWPAVAFWVFDRVVRVARLIVLNYKVAFGKQTKVLASYSAERDIIRLSVTPSYHHKPQPGSYYFLYFPTMLKALGNHPFTMATWSAGEKGILPNPLLNQSRSGSQEKKIGSTEIKTVESEVISQSSHSIDTSDPHMKLHFIIRPYKGLTSALRDRILQSGHSHTELTALVEGPYGETHPVLTYNNIIFIAGGSGIAAVLPYLQTFLLGNSAQPTKRVHIIWAARQQTFVRDVLDHELAPATTHSNVKLDLYVTGASPKPVKDMTVDLDRFDDDIGMRYARPAIATLLPAEVRESVGTTAVLVCGPAQMADDARLASVKAVVEGYGGLGYYEEFFGW